MRLYMKNDRLPTCDHAYWTVIMYMKDFPVNECEKTGEWREGCEEMHKDMYTKMSEYRDFLQDVSLETTTMCEK